MKTLGGLLEWASDGDFTIYRHVSNLGHEELEDKIGFHKGRLDQGAIVAVIFRPDLDFLSTQDFTLGASSRWSRSAAAAKWAPEYTKLPLESEQEKGEEKMQPNAIEQALFLKGQHPNELKSKVLAFFKTGGENTPAKVFPLQQHKAGMTYPSPNGAGVPQFMLLKKVHWVIKRIIPARA
jgi:hypothetical protein